MLTFTLSTPPKKKFLGHSPRSPLLLPCHCHHLHAHIWSFINFSSSLRLFVIKISYSLFLAFKKSSLNNYILSLRHSTMPWNVTVSKLLCSLPFFAFSVFYSFKTSLISNLSERFLVCLPLLGGEGGFLSCLLPPSSPVCGWTLSAHFQGPQKPASVCQELFSLETPKA